MLDRPSRTRIDGVRDPTAIDLAGIAVIARGGHRPIAQRDDPLNAASGHRRLDADTPRTVEVIRPRGHDLTPHFDQVARQPGLPQGRRHLIDAVSLGHRRQISLDRRDRLAQGRRRRVQLDPGVADVLAKLRQPLGIRRKPIGFDGAETPGIDQRSDRDVQRPRRQLAQPSGLAHDLERIRRHRERPGRPLAIEPRELGRRQVVRHLRFDVVEHGLDLRADPVPLGLRPGVDGHHPDGIGGSHRGPLEHVEGRPGVGRGARRQQPACRKDYGPGPDPARRPAGLPLAPSDAACRPSAGSRHGRPNRNRRRECSPVRPPANRACPCTP